MRLVKVSSVVLFFFLVVGCAGTPQQPIEFSKANFSQDAVVAVVMTETPQPTMGYPGAGCLLCLGVAAAANGDLSGHVKTLPNDDLKSLGQELADSLSAKGLKVTSDQEFLVLKNLKKVKGGSPESAKKDFMPLKEKYKASHLIVIDIESVGVARNYANYIPTSDPYVGITGAAYMVNLATNTYEWYLPIFENKHADGEWKEPPSFPGLTNTYFATVERIRESILAITSKI